MNKMFFKMLAVVMIFSTISCFSSPVNKNNSDNPKNPPISNKFIGTWQLCKSDSTVITDLNRQVGNVEYKIVTGETFTVILIQKIRLCCLIL